MSRLYYRLVFHVERREQDDTLERRRELASTLANWGELARFQVSSGSRVRRSGERYWVVACYAIGSSKPEAEGMCAVAHETLAARGYNVIRSHVPHGMTKLELDKKVKNRTIVDVAL